MLTGDCKTCCRRARNSFSIRIRFAKYGKHKITNTVYCRQTKRHNQIPMLAKCDEFESQILIQKWTLIWLSLEFHASAARTWFANDPNATHARISKGGFNFAPTEQLRRWPPLNVALRTARSVRTPNPCNLITNSAALIIPSPEWTRFDERAKTSRHHSASSASSRRTGQPDHRKLSPKFRFTVHKYCCSFQALEHTLQEWRWWWWEWVLGELRTIRNSSTSGRVHVLLTRTSLGLASSSLINLWARLLMYNVTKGVGERYVRL